MAKKKDASEPVKAAPKVDATDPVKAVAPMAEMLGSSDGETMRAGKRQLWQVVRHVGRPENDMQKQAVVGELLKLLSKTQPLAVRREALWMVSELGGDECIAPMAALLAEPQLREDARLVLQRMPGDQATAALQAGLKAAPGEFKVNIASSLRARGVQVAGLPDGKLKPERQTKVTPVGR